MKKAVILLSGGLDSSTCLAIARQEGYECHCISFDYGQKHKIELSCAKKQVALQGAKTHSIIDLNPLAFKGSALTDININVPDGDIQQKEIPVTYVPARNTIFLSYALGLAEQIKAYDIFIGVNAIDYSGYPDCRVEFIQAFEKMANLATKIYVEGDKKLNIKTPLINLTKAEIITNDYTVFLLKENENLDEIEVSVFKSKAKTNRIAEQIAIVRKKEIQNTLNKDVFDIRVYSTDYYKNFSPSTNFTKWAAVEVSTFEGMPDGMKSISMDGGQYAVFTIKATDSNPSVFQYIFTQWLPNSNYQLDDRPHFDILGEKIQRRAANAEEEIWIPIQ